MKLPVLLKEAIIEGNWEKVCFVYTAITGEEISPFRPKPIEIQEKTEEEILKDLDLDLITPAIIDKEELVTTKTKSKEDFIATAKREESLSPNEEDDDGRKKARKIPFGTKNFRPQLFVDNRTEAVNDLVENNSTLAKMYVPPRERNRKNNMMKVECSVCGKTLEVSSVLASTYDPDPKENTFKCDNCITRKR